MLTTCALSSSDAVVTGASDNHTESCVSLDRADAPTSYELELALSRVIDEHAGSARIALTFDSEGDQVVLQVGDQSDALQLVQILDTFLADSEKLREYLATTRG